MATSRAEALAIGLLKRVEANKHLNAFVALDSQKILEAARAADLARGRGERVGRYTACQSV
jgi:Asp-tRNA(Asn)/Glu-tRNA(Gln) amidotransferase A subunit family amidase